jgi:hypothetical protein
MKEVTPIHQNISSVNRINTFVVKQLPISQGAPAACSHKSHYCQVLTSEHYGRCMHAISRKIKLNFNSFAHLITQEAILYEKIHGPRLQKFRSNFKISVNSTT